MDEKKKVDEDWKSQVEAEKEKLAEEAEAELPPLPQASFFTHVTSVATQVMLSLGEMEHPITKEKRKSLPEAKFGIDILGMLEEKTKGNLTDDENRYLQEVLAELRMKYVQVSREPM